MINSIRGTIVDTVNLPVGSESYLDAAVSALVTREQAIGQNLVDFAVGQGLSQFDAIEAVQGSGLNYQVVQAEPEVAEPEVAESVALDGSLARLADVLGEVLTALRQR